MYTMVEIQSQRRRKSKVIIFVNGIISKCLIDPIHPAVTRAVQPSCLTAQGTATGTSRCTRRRCGRQRAVATAGQIVIMDYTLFPEHRRFFTRYVLQDDEGYRFSDKQQIELAKHRLPNSRLKKAKQCLPNYKGCHRSKDKSYRPLSFSSLNFCIRSSTAFLIKPFTDSPTVAAASKIRSYVSF